MYPYCVYIRDFWKLVLGLGMGGVRGFPTGSLRALWLLITVIMSGHEHPSGASIPVSGRSPGLRAGTGTPAPGARGVSRRKGAGSAADGGVGAGSRWTGRPTARGPGSRPGGSGRLPGQLRGPGRGGRPGWGGDPVFHDNAKAARTKEPQSAFYWFELII